MKRFICSIAVLFMLLTAMFTRTMATDESRSFTFDLTVDGGDIKNAGPGDVITVLLTLRRMDSKEDYAMYAMQDELKYDPAFFELVEGGALTADGIVTADVTLRDGSREYYMNFLSLGGGETWPADMVVGSFQLKVIAQEGISVISNENYLVSTRDGSDTYTANANDVTVVITTKCKVHFETNGGSEIADTSAIFGETIERPGDPEREGYIFAGWYADLDLTKPWDFVNDTVRGNMTLYAAWTKNAAQATTPAEDGGLPGWLIPCAVGLAALLLAFVVLLRVKVDFYTSGGSTPDPVYVRRGAKLNPPETPRKDGCVFAGWYRDEALVESWDFEKDRVKSRMILHAKWM